MMPPAPIRGRWTIRYTVTGPDTRTASVDVVPVPDEAAIERGAKALAVMDGFLWDELAEEDREWDRQCALAVLRAALGDPEAP